MGINPNFIKSKCWSPLYALFFYILSHCGQGVDYNQNKEPVIAVGKLGKAENELDYAASVAVDESNQLIYIADYSNRRTQVVSFAGNFLKRFGQGILKQRYGIAETEDNVFVTDSNLHALLQFSKKDYKLTRRTGNEGIREGQLNYPSGLCIDINGDAYVADCWNTSLRLLKRTQIPILSRNSTAEVS